MWVWLVDVGHGLSSTQPISTWTCLLLIRIIRKKSSTWLWNFSVNYSSHVVSLIHSSSRNPTNIWSFEPDKRSPTSSFTVGSCIGHTIAHGGTEREHPVTQTPCYCSSYCLRPLTQDDGARAAAIYLMQTKRRSQRFYHSSAWPSWKVISIIQRHPMQRDDFSKSWNVWTRTSEPNI